jgi:hypothetical protein
MIRLCLRSRRVKIGSLVASHYIFPDFLIFWICYVFYEIYYTHSCFSKFCGSLKKSPPTKIRRPFQFPCPRGCPCHLVTCMFLELGSLVCVDDERSSHVYPQQWFSGVLIWPAKHWNQRKDFFLKKNQPDKPIFAEGSPVFKMYENSTLLPVQRAVKVYRPFR